MIGEILIKISEGKTLNDNERKILLSWGNMSELNEGFILGLQNGGSDISVGKITAISGKYRYAPAGYTTKIRTTSITTVPNSVQTAITWHSKYYDDLGIFPGSGETSIPIKLTGKYRFVIWSQLYSNPAASSGLINVVLYGTGGRLLEETNVPFSTGFYTSFQLVGEASIRAGDSVSAKILQTSGASMEASGSITLSLVKEYDSEVLAT